jgi:ABC-type multidrug transport system fused ATPase/permease subunit
LRVGPEKFTPFALLRWSLSPSPGEFAALAATFLGVWGCELAIPFLLGRTVDAAITKRQALAGLAELGGATLLLTVVLYLLHAAYLRSEARIVARATIDLRQYLYRRVIAQPLSFFSDYESGEIGHQIMSDAEVIDNHGIYLLADVPFAVLSAVSIFIVMFLTQHTLALLILATLAGAVMLSRHVGHPLSAVEKAARERWALMGGLLQNTLAAIRTVKLFGRQKHEMKRLDRANLDLANAEIETGRVVARLEPLIGLIRASGVLLVVWYGAYLVYTDALTAGMLVSFIAYMERMNESVQDAGSYYRHYEQAKGTLGHIEELLSRLSPNPPAGGSFSTEVALQVELRDVGFTYPGRSAAVFQNVSLVAGPGEIIAILGANGSGKTTLLDIVLGLRMAGSGSVLIGGTPIADWDDAALRKAISAIPQDIVLFNGTLEDNIRYGAPDATDDEIGAVLKNARLSDVVARLPNGLKSTIGNSGAALSGRERQRVAVARALVSRPKILVLDEPDSMLDQESTADLMRVLRRDNLGRVTLVVTHNLQTALEADKTLILESGKLERRDLFGAEQMTVV